MKLQPWLLVTLISGFLSCNPDDPLPLIRQYEVLWEVNLADRYGDFATIPHKIHLFNQVFVNPNGTIYVIHHPENTYNSTYVTLLDASGAYLADLILPDEYLFSVQSTTGGNMLSASSTDSGYLLKTWNENLSSSVLKTIPPVAYFRQLYIQNNAYYEISYNTALNDNELIHYDFNDQIRWKNRLSTYQAEGHTQLLFYAGNQDILLVNSKHDYQNLVLNRINAQSGSSVWRKEMVLQQYGFTSPMPSINILPDGNLILFDKFNYIQISAGGAIQTYSRIGNVDSIPENNITGCIRETDGGFLLVISFTEAEGWYGFRLLKTDAHLNVGWVGNFQQSTPGFLSDYDRQGDVLILLTSNGYLYAIKPAS